MQPCGMGLSNILATLVESIIVRAPKLRIPNDVLKKADKVDKPMSPPPASYSLKSLSAVSPPPASYSEESLCQSQGFVSHKGHQRI